MSYQFCMSCPDGPTALFRKFHAYLSDLKFDNPETRFKFLEFAREPHCPNNLWSASEVHMLLNMFSKLDTNNMSDASSVGEREGRVESDTVSQRHSHMSHGIGRSGDISEQQPKAIGSTYLYAYTNYLAFTFFKHVGLKGTVDCLVMPMDTSATLGLCIKAIAQKRRFAKYVWLLRIDDESIIKVIVEAGMTPVLLNSRVETGIGDGFDPLGTDFNNLISHLEHQDTSLVCCLISSISCIGIRIPDKIYNIGHILKTYNIPQVVNYEHGLLCTPYNHMLEESLYEKVVEYYVVSTNESFRVASGGSILASPIQGNIEKFAQLYPGRASASQVVDMFMSLMTRGYYGDVELRLSVYKYALHKVQDLAKTYHLTLMTFPKNMLSISCKLQCAERMDAMEEVCDRNLCKNFFKLCIDTPLKSKEIMGVTVNNWGMQIDNILLSDKISYITIPVFFSTTKDDIDHILGHLEARFRTQKRRF